MTPQNKTAMTEEQKIAYLAEKVMGWEKDWISPDFYFWIVPGTPKHVAPIANKWWNPITDWNHFRQVEEKVMEDFALLSAFMHRLIDRQPEEDDYVALLKADLPTRVDALISAHQSLHDKA